MPPTLPIALPPVAVSWTKRDTLLFANTIGCTNEHLHYLYEKHPDFAAFPTYPIVLTFKHSYRDVVEFRNHFDRYINVEIPGVPRLDSTRVVDGGRSLQIVRHIPSCSDGRDMRLQSIVIDASDKGKAGTVIVLEHMIYEQLEAGVAEIFTIMRETAFYIGQGGWGGLKGPPLLKIVLPQSIPTFHAVHSVPRTAHLLYRLNGDYNPLHVDPVAAQESGQKGVIMHGLYTWNVTCNLILTRFAGDRAHSLKAFEGRFLRPVKPGDDLTISAWSHTSKGTDQTNTIVVIYAVRLKEDDLCLAEYDIRGQPGY